MYDVSKNKMENKLKIIAETSTSYDCLGSGSMAPERKIFFISRFVVITNFIFAEMSTSNTQGRIYCILTPIYWIFLNFSLVETKRISLNV